MANRALTFGNGGYADLAVTFGEFVHADHTLTLRFMPQYPYGPVGPMLSDAGVGSIYSLGQGDYRSGTGDFKKLGPSTLLVRIGGASVVYLVEGFTNQVDGPVGYRDAWQHLAVVREVSAFRTYLNGKRLSAFSGTEAFLSSQVPSDSTLLRVGRRDLDQFYGLIADVAIFTQALTDTEVKTAADPQHWLTGNEAHLLAGFTFQTGLVQPPTSLTREVTLPTASEIPDYVTSNADHPVPAYYVNVSASHDNAADSKKYDLRPSKVGATLPFCAGEWWHVVQGHDEPAGSHNGTATFSWDSTRINGDTPGSRVIAAAPGRLYYADKQVSDHTIAISVYHAANERAVYMHVENEEVYANFPSLDHHLPQSLSVDQQPAFAARDPLTNVAHPQTFGPHLHLEIATQQGDTFAGAGVGQPVGIVGYYQSKDNGETWNQVPLGVPAKGDMISRYPWSPFGEDGDPLDVAPAVSSRGPNRLDVFACGQNGHLWIVKWDGQSWSKWEELGSGRLTSSPAAVSWDEYRIDVFVRGHEGQLAHKRWTSDGGWSAWDDLGGRLTSAPAVASWGPNRLDVFMRGHEGQLVHKRWSQHAGWGPWDDLGGRLTSAPAAVSWGQDRIDVFVRGHEGQLAHKRWSEHAGWGNWDDLGGRLTSAPAVASWGSQRLDVFMRGHDGQLVHKRWSEHAGWGNWDDLGGRLTSGPAAVSWAEERIDIFVRGHEHGLASMSWTPGTSWSPWKNLDK